ncbi:MAG: arrestin family protein [Candidatus Bathyarchaeota archaeon]|nr:arrestin family protein [Candidatus Bathyarchaeota archaeon]
MFKPKKTPVTRSLLAYATVFLILAFALTFFRPHNSLFSGTVSVQASTDKYAYLQGENITIQAILVNGKSEAFIYPDRMGFAVEEPNGHQVYNLETRIQWASPTPTLAAHSKTLFHSDLDNATFIWDQKGYFGGYALYELSPWKLHNYSHPGKLEEFPMHD